MAADELRPVCQRHQQHPGEDEPGGRGSDGAAAALATSPEGQATLDLLRVQDEPGAVLEAVVALRADSLRLRSLTAAQEAEAAAAGPPPISAHALTPDQLAAFGDALRLDATDDDLRGLVMRLNLAGLRVVPADDLAALCAWMLRRSARDFAGMAQRLADQYARSDDVDLVEEVSPIANDDLLARWLEP